MNFIIPWTRNPVFFSMKFCIGNDMTYPLFKNRTAAGKELLSRLLSYKNKKDTIVLGLPRGGVICASEIAKGLHLPLDVLIPRKIGAPFNPELAIGALCEEEIVLDLEIIRALAIPESFIQGEIAKEKEEAKRRLKLYRKNKPPLDLKNKTVILVDDGIATGATITAAIQAVRSHKTKKLIVAVPVAPPETIEKISHEVDEVIALYTPISFMAVGQFYEVFDQTKDEEIVAIFAKEFS